MKTKMIKPLDTNAPRERTNVAVSNSDKKYILITKGFRLGNLLLYPLQEWAYTDWGLIATESGLTLATFSYKNLALGKSVLLLASKLDWSGKNQSQINPKTIQEWKVIIEFIGLDTENVI